MVPFQTRTALLEGSSFDEVKKKIRLIYKKIEQKSRRRTYIRSAYFNKDKIFFDYFWHHLAQKNRKIKTKRLKLFPAALDLISNCRNQPASKENPNNTQELLHRFYGLTKEKSLFCVQIKEDKKTSAKYFMSVFAPE